MARSPVEEVRYSAEIDGSSMGYQISASRDSGFQAFVIRFTMSCLLYWGAFGICLSGAAYRFLVLNCVLFGIYREFCHLRRRVEDTRREKRKQLKDEGVGTGEDDHDDETPLYYSLAYAFYFSLLLANTATHFRRVSDALTELDGGWHGIILWARWLEKNRKQILFCVHITAVIAVVMTLRAAGVKRQLKHLFYMWIPALIMTVCAKILFELPLKGVYWFWIAIGSVVCNDSSAYCVGKLFGKTPFHMLSPRKTWEGFIGGAIITHIVIITKAVVPLYFPGTLCAEDPISFSAIANIQFLTKTCPASDFLTEWHTYDILGASVPFTWCHFHSFIMAFVASFVSPFGGLLASAMKRSLNLKDFGSVFANHGGFIDRFDCMCIGFTFLAIYIEVIERSYT